MNTKISYNPTQKEIEEIITWLLEEKKTKKEGFFDKWKDGNIPGYYKDNKLAVISLDETVVGFIAWSEFQIMATINFAEVKPDCRNKGIGKILLGSLIEKFLQKGIYAITLSAEPVTSVSAETVWKRMGFMEFPDNGPFWKKGKDLYKIISPIYTPDNTSDMKDGEFIELWNEEPYLTKEMQPLCRWKLMFKENKRELVQPIIYPCHYDWRIRWIKKGETIYDEKVKRLGKGEAIVGDFLYLSKIDAP